MLLVERTVVGAIAFDRLARDGVIHEVLGAWALPADIPSTRALRAHLVRDLVPRHAWLTGLAALWLEGYARAPRMLDVVAARGAHRAIPVPGSPPVRLHAGSLLGVPDAGSPRVVGLARACVDALWHSPTASALPAVASALRGGETSAREVRGLATTCDVRTRGRARVLSLVEALEGL
ncbi:hypothetical protein [Demequina sp.]|uniref:hypothetical protein n=1 Tax=Demequina sp. TaxID=2050685 RepID=UPI003D0B58F4